MEQNCFRPECTKLKHAILKCIKCNNYFCEWHLLFTTNVSIETQCLCCFLDLERSLDFKDPAISDSVAIALQDVKPEFRNKVLDFKRSYDQSQENAFGPDGPGYWWPKMAPPAELDIKNFLIKHAS